MAAEPAPPFHLHAGDRWVSIEPRLLPGSGPRAFAKNPAPILPAQPATSTASQADTLRLWQSVVHAHRYVAVDPQSSPGSPAIYSGMMVHFARSFSAAARNIQPTIAAARLRPAPTSRATGAPAR